MSTASTATKTAPRATTTPPNGRPRPLGIMTDDGVPSRSTTPKKKPKKKTRRPAPKSKPRQEAPELRAFAQGLAPRCDASFVGCAGEAVANVARLVQAAVAGALAAVLNTHSGDGSGDGTGSVTSPEIAPAHRPAGNPETGAPVEYEHLPLFAKIIRTKLQAFYPEQSNNPIVLGYVTERAEALYTWMYGFSPYGHLPDDLGRDFARTFAPCVHLVVNELARNRTKRGPAPTGAALAA